MIEKLNLGQDSPGPEKALTIRQAASTPLPSQLVYLEPMESSAAPGQRPGPLEFFHILRQRPGILLCFGLAGLLVAFFIVLCQEPVYEAKTTLEIVQAVPENSIVLRLNDSQANTGGGFNPESYIQTQAQILQSKSLYGAALARVMSERKSWAFASADRLSWLRNQIRFANIGPTQSEDGHPDVSARVRVLENTKILEITSLSSNPKLSATFANALVQEYLEGHLNARWKASQRNLDWMTRQLDNLKDKLQKAEVSLQAYGRSNGIVIEADHPDAGGGQLASLREELSRVQADRIAKQSAYEVAMGSPTDSLPQVIENTRLGGYETKLSDLRREMADLRTQFTPEYYKVVQLQAQITELEGTLNNERQAILTGIHNQYKISEIRERLLTSSYVNLQRDVMDRTGRAVNYEIQKGEVDSLRQLYDEVLKKSQSAVVSLAAHSDDARVIDPADAPAESTSPRVAMDLVMGWVSATFFGGIFIVCQTYFRRNLTDPGEAPFHLRIPELAVIPEVAFLADGLRRNGNSNSLYSLKGADHWAEDSSEKICVVQKIDGHNDASIAGEAYRNAVTSLLGHVRWSGGAAVLLATSTERGDGKSATVSNLGIALAETGRKVLLVDADLRKPRLHQIFGISNSWGLTDLLRENTQIEDLPLDCLARVTNVSNLSLLSSGPGVASVYQLLHSPRLENLLHRLRREFDIILIDTPPMFPVSDARIVGRCTDGALLVIRSGKTAREAAAYAKQLLESDGITIVGTVLSRWNMKSKSHYGHYSTYRYYSDQSDGYGSRDHEKAEADA